MSPAHSIHPYTNMYDLEDIQIQAKQVGDKTLLCFTLLDTLKCAEKQRFFTTLNCCLKIQRNANIYYHHHYILYIYIDI